METRRFTDRNEGFTCTHCGKAVLPAGKSCRNHCPSCLYSLHLDVNPGDRAANCGGVMVPIQVIYNTKKGYQVVHRCEKCGAVAKNILCFDGNPQPDSLETALKLMRTM